MLGFDDVSEDNDNSETIGVEMALERARGGGERDPIADALLLKQTDKLAQELRNLKLKTVNEWFAILLKGLTVLAGIAVGGAVLAMTLQASQSHGLVVAPFHVPPDMAEKGTDGQVLASRVLDKLNDMRAQTDIQAQNSGYSSEQAGEIKLEIPETGITFGELRRLLRDWLGHDIRISGSLERQSDGDTAGQLVLTTRTGDTSKASAGTEKDLGRLTETGAESIYAATQPLAFVDYLRGHQRIDEAEALLRRLTTQGAPEQRAWAYTELGEILMRNRGDFVGARRAMDEAALLNPKLWKVWENLADLYVSFLPDEERALSYRRKAVTANDFGGADANSGRHFHLTDQIYIDEQLGDFGHALSINQAEAEAQADPGLAYQSAYLVGYEAAYLHDLALSRRWTGRAMDHAASMQVAGFKLYNPVLVQHRLAYWHAALVDDWAGAERQIAAANAITPSDYWLSLQAIALIGIGQVPQARALLQPLRARCYYCNVARGMLAEAEHNPAGADRIFAALAQDYPSLARRQDVWGRIKLARGDYDGAIAVFARVSRIGPHYADPLEGWGEALLRKGDVKAAAQKFAQAANIAPAWGRLRLGWGIALKTIGKKAEAERQFAIADGLALSAADRALLTAQRQVPAH